MPNRFGLVDGLGLLVDRPETVNDVRVIWLRVVGWCGLAAFAEGVALAAMMWLLSDAVRALPVLPSSDNGGPVTLFALAAMGMGWINARLVSNLWGVGWSATIPLSAQTVIAVGVGWFLGTSFLTPLPSDYIEMFVMVGIVLSGTAGVVLRFEW